MLAAITSDIDTLDSIYRGQGCRRMGGYTRAEFRIGLENFDRFLEPYKARATLFMVGRDFTFTANHETIRAVARAGHEIANHTMTHAQGFRFLTPEGKEREIAEMEAACEQVAGVRPVGFRSPGWNVGDDAIPILARRGYRYDSSVFPTSVAPLLRFMHWKTMSSRAGGDRTTLGHWSYLIAPTTPYRTSERTLGRRGAGPLMEYPVTVTPVLRLPFFATFLVSTGLALFESSFNALRRRGAPIQFQFHLSDFVDYTTPEFTDQVPGDRDGVYVPAALRWPLTKKVELFRRVMDRLAGCCEFKPLVEWGSRVKGVT